MSLDRAKKDFDLARSEFAGAVAAAGITLREARNGIVAAHDILSALADAATDADELEHYVQGMQALTAELTAVVNAELQNSEARYAPITAAIKGAAGSLKAAKKRADELASKLELAADALGAFTRLLSVLKP